VPGGVGLQLLPANGGGSLGFFLPMLQFFHVLLECCNPLLHFFQLLFCDHRAGPSTVAGSLLPIDAVRLDPDHAPCRGRHRTLEAEAMATAPKQPWWRAIAGRWTSAAIRSGAGRGGDAGSETVARPRQRSTNGMCRCRGMPASPQWAYVERSEGQNKAGELCGLTLWRPGPEQGRHANGDHRAHLICINAHPHQT